MKYQIGLLVLGTDESPFDQEEWEMKNGYKLTVLDREEQIDSLDGIVVTGIHSGNMLLSVQWLLSNSDDHPLHVWLISEESSDQLTHMIRRLKPNMIVEHFHSSLCKEKLFLAIQNGMSYREQLLYTKLKEQQSEDIFLKHDIRCLCWAQGEVLLTNFEYKLLACLLNNVDQVVSYERLIEEIWKEKATKDFKYRLANLVFHLRKKIRRLTQYELVIVRLIGYSLRERG